MPVSLSAASRGDGPARQGAGLLIQWWFHLGGSKGRRDGPVDRKLPLPASPRIRSGARGRPATVPSVRHFDQGLGPRLRPHFGSPLDQHPDSTGELDEGDPVRRRPTFGRGRNLRRGKHRRLRRYPAGGAGDPAAYCTGREPLRIVRSVHGAPSLPRIVTKFWAPSPPIDWASSHRVDPSIWVGPA